jgi:hypothetical protein
MSVQQTAEMEMLEIPGGGIGTFVDEDLYGNDEPDFPVSGIGQYTEIADEIAGHGRFGDNVVAHLERGELVIPKELLDDDPAWRDSIFTYLSSQGVENPERYVVGSNDNSINPATGIREFFFKKIFKSVKKFVKKAAPIVLPLVLGAGPLGPVFGGALGTGIASLINGNSLTDSFKSAAISGLMGAGFAGIGAMGSGGPGFFKGVTDAFANPAARFEQFGSGLRNLASQGSFGAISGSQAAPDAGIFDTFNPDLFVDGTSDYKSMAPPARIGPTDRYGMELAPKSGVVDRTMDDITKQFEGFGELTKDYFPRTEESQKAFTQLKVDQARDFALKNNKEFTDKMFKEAVASAQPGFKQYVGPAALAGVGAYALGAFDEEEGPSFQETADSLGFGKLDPLPPIFDPAKFREQRDPYATTPITSGYGLVQAAEGGPIYPRRNGGIMPDEGVRGKDSVRALLMPGEFVMTTDAVRGAGKGNLETGIRNMYSVMRNLESRAS